MPATIVPSAIATLASGTERYFFPGTNGSETPSGICALISENSDISHSSMLSAANFPFSFFAASTTKLFSPVVYMERLSSLFHLM